MLRKVTEPVAGAVTAAVRVIEPWIGICVAERVRVDAVGMAAMVKFAEADDGGLLTSPEYVATSGKTPIPRVAALNGRVT